MAEAYGWMVDGGRINRLNSRYFLVHSRAMINSQTSMLIPSPRPTAQHYFSEPVGFGGVAPTYKSDAGAYHELALRALCAAAGFCFDVTLVTMQAFVLYAIPLWVMVLVMLAKLPG